MRNRFLIVSSSSSSSSSLVPIWARSTLFFPLRRCLSATRCSPDGCGEDEEGLSQDWYYKAYPKLLKLAHTLSRADQPEYTVPSNSTNEDDIIRAARQFRTIGWVFVGSPTAQAALARTQPLRRDSRFFATWREREGLLLDTLTKVCDFLSISAQHRKSVRLELCRQVAKQHVWRGALLQVLEDLQSEIQSQDPKSAAFAMTEQIVSSCLKFLEETGNPSLEDEPPLWMRLSPAPKRKPRVIGEPSEPRRWEELSDMFTDLTEYLEVHKATGSTRLAACLAKAEAMKDGLYLIKDVIVEREVGYKEACHQDGLVRKRLSAGLGHSSKCLFAMLLYYLFGSVRDVEVEACGLRGSVAGGQGVMVFAGKVLWADDEKLVLRGMRQLDRALGLFKFVWETAGMKGRMELQGHLWCVGAKERTVIYRGNNFFIHTFRLF